MQCAVCGYDAYVEICHLTPIADYDSDDLVVTINALSNLVALCPTHHKEHDNGLLCQDDLRAVREVASTFPELLDN